MTANPLNGSENGARDGGDGRFVPGNPGGPGRPSRVVEDSYLKVLRDACPPETWREVCARAVTQAKNGDHRAREWLGRHLLEELSEVERRLMVKMLLDGLVELSDEFFPDPLVRDRFLMALIAQGRESAAAAAAAPSPIDGSTPEPGQAQ